MKIEVRVVYKEEHQEHTHTEALRVVVDIQGRVTSRARQ